jgi:ATP-binding cassette, subfamily B, bacterial
MVTIRRYVKELQYFIRGYEYYAIFLLLLAIFIGLIDAFSIALFYPMLSEGFQIQTSTLPLSGIYTYVDSLIPIGSPFVHLGLLFIALTGFSLLLQLIYWKIAFIFKRHIVVNAKKEIFSKIEQNDYRFFVDSKQGDLINLFNQNPIYIEATYDRVISLCADFFASFVVVCMLFIISPIGMILVIFGGIIFYVVMHIIGVNVSEKMGLLQIASGQSENKVINEFINGVKAIFSHNATEHWKREYNSALNTYWDKYAEYMFIQRIPIIALNSLFYISIGVVVLFVYIYYSENFISVIPVLGTFAAGTMKVLPKFMNMGDYKLQLKIYLPHVDIVYTSLHDTTYTKVKNGSLQYSGLESEIRFQDVSFKYNFQQVLKGINFSIKKGYVTALIGPSGSGKSTIVNLLLRLYDVSEGVIEINGKNIKDYNILDFRNHIGYVSQDPFVFHASIRDNIFFGENFQEHELIRAAKLAHIHDFIGTLPQGYDTIIGDLGLTLSGGEKQRIVIARAMIRQPDLLILDEATSALDNESESIVQKAIDEIAEECTTLVIAHRLTTIQKANVIYVLEKGKIVESGNHEYLLSQKGRYWDLWTATDKVSR